MSCPQFSLKSLLWLMTIVCVAIFFGMHWHQYAPIWGEPRRIQDGDTIEARYWTGRRVIEGRVRRAPDDCDDVAAGEALPRATEE